MEMSQHYEMTDATPLACSVIVIQSYTKVAGTLLHFTNQIHRFINRFHWLWGVANNASTYLHMCVCTYYVRTYVQNNKKSTCTHFCQFLSLSLYVFLSDYSHWGYLGDTMGDEVGWWSCIVNIVLGKWYFP